MTSVFGPCGIGWKFNIADEKTFQCGDGQILLFLTVALMYHDGEGWSEPVYGCGGDFIVEKNKNGLVPNDEAYKMCLTDALGNAMKCIGVAADVYRGLWDSKYGESHRTEPQAPRQTKAAAKHTDKVSRYQLAQLQTMAKQKGVDVAGIAQSLQLNNLQDITAAQWAQCMNSLRKRADA